MKPEKRLLFGRLILLLFLFWSCGGQPNAPEAKVVNIADGDTFTLLYPGNLRVKVRLYGIDSPERSQAYGTAAKRALGELLEGHQVRLEEMDKDRYGRTVAIAFREDGLSINEAMLQQGYAWHYTQYDKNPKWSEMEQQARKKRLGLWADPYPTPPWEWRKQKRAKKAQLPDQAL